MASCSLFTWRCSYVFTKILTHGHSYRKYYKSKHCQFISCKYATVPEDRSEEKQDKKDSAGKGNNQDVTGIKLKILKAGLNFVPEHGWTKKSLALGAHSIGFSPASHTLIQDGGADLVHFFNFSCNEELEKYLKAHYSSCKEKINTQNYIEDALESRLKMVIPFASKWSEAMALMMSPAQFPVASKNLLDLVDIIWTHSGDKSLDVTWYSQRLSLALMYKMCELSLVQDKSPEFSDTFGFLRRRVANVMDTTKCINKISNSCKYIPEFGIGTLITVRNILGANRLCR